MTRGMNRAYVSYVVECELAYRFVGHIVYANGVLTAVLWNYRGLADPRYGKDQDITGGVTESEMHLYTVYRKPKDYPDKYVIRKWKVGNRGNGSSQLSEIFAVGDSLKEVRSHLLDTYPTLVKTSPMDGDDSCIVETWL